MGNLININPNVVLSKRSANSAPVQDGPTTKFDAKNYLNVRLDKKAKETSKTLTIRLLPMNLETGDCFEFVHYHNVKVPHEIADSGFKSYLCLAKNKDIDHDKFGHKCPFCELNKRAYEEALTETDPVKQKMLKEISIANHSRQSVICRCIERGKEDEGVKFWKFNLRADETDPYNQIISLLEQRRAEGKAIGQDINILSIYEDGYDLTIKITAEGTSAPTVTDVKFPSPLSKDEAQMEAWLNDSKKWQDVFTPKSYEYLSLVSEQKVPWYDRENKTWVDKDEYDNGVSANRASAENNVKAAEDAITGSTITTMTVDTDKMTVSDDLPW